MNLIHSNHCNSNSKCYTKQNLTPTLTNRREISSNSFSKNNNNNNSRAKSSLNLNLNEINNLSSGSEVSCDTIVYKDNNNCNNTINKNNSNSLLLSYSSSSSSSSNSPTTSISSSNSLNNKSNNMSTLRPTKIKLGVSSSIYHNNRIRSSSTDSKQSNSKQNEIWIDGPNAAINKTKINTNNNNSITNNRPVKQILAESINLNEIWIDGPNAQLPKSDVHTIKCPHQLFNNNNNSNSNNKNIDTLDTLECLDRALLRQLNEQEMNLIDTVNKLDADDCNSRPISLLSVNSNDTSSVATTTNTSMTIDNNNNNGSSFQKKLQDLKTSYDQMIFKQSYKEMESLHKTLESFLNLDNHQVQMIMKPIQTTMLAPANDLLYQNIISSSPESSEESAKRKARLENLKKISELKLNNMFDSNLFIDQLNTPQESEKSSMTNREKEKRLSRILSPTRFRPAPHIEQLVLNDQEVNGITNKTAVLSSSSSSASSPSTISSSSSYNCSPSSTASSSSNNNNNHYSTPVYKNNNTKRVSIESQHYAEPFDFINNRSNNTGYVYTNKRSVSTQRQKPSETSISTNTPNRLFFNFNNKNIEDYYATITRNSVCTTNNDSSQSTSSSLLIKKNEQQAKKISTSPKKGHVSLRQESGELSCKLNNNSKSCKSTTKSNDTNNKKLNKSKSVSCSINPTSINSSPSINQQPVLKQIASLFSTNSNNDNNILGNDLIMNCHSLKRKNKNNNNKTSSSSNSSSSSNTEDYYYRRVDANNENTSSSPQTNLKSKDSFLNKIFNRSKSKDKMSHHQQQLQSTPACLNNSTISSIMMADSIKMMHQQHNDDLSLLLRKQGISPNTTSCLTDNSENFLNLNESYQSVNTINNNINNNNDNNKQTGKISYYK